MICSHAPVYADNFLHTYTVHQENIPFVRH